MKSTFLEEGLIERKKNREGRTQANRRTGVETGGKNTT